MWSKVQPLIYIGLPIIRIWSKPKGSPFIIPYYLIFPPGNEINYITKWGTIPPKKVGKYSEY